MTKHKSVTKVRSNGDVDGIQGLSPTTSVFGNSHAKKVLFLPLVSPKKENKKNCFCYCSFAVFFFGDECSEPNPNPEQSPASEKRPKTLKSHNDRKNTFFFCCCWKTKKYLILACEFLCSRIFEYPYVR